MQGGVGLQTRLKAPQACRPPSPSPAVAVAAMAATAPLLRPPLSLLPLPLPEAEPLGAPGGRPPAPSSVGAGCMRFVYSSPAPGSTPGPTTTPGVANSRRARRTSVAEAFLWSSRYCAATPAAMAAAPAALRQWAAFAACWEPGCGGGDLSARIVCGGESVHEGLQLQAVHNPAKSKPSRRITLGFCSTPLTACLEMERV